VAYNISDHETTPNTCVNALQLREFWGGKQTYCSVLIVLQ